MEIDNEKKNILLTLALLFNTLIGNAWSNEYSYLTYNEETKDIVFPPNPEKGDEDSIDLQENGHQLSLAIGYKLSDESEENKWIAKTATPEDKEIIYQLLESNNEYSKRIPYFDFLWERNIKDVDSTSFIYRWLKVVNPETNEVEAFVLLDRMPRGVMSPKEQEGNLKNYKNMEALTTDEEKGAGKTKYQGDDYYFIKDHGLLQIHAVFSSKRQDDTKYATSVIKGITDVLSTLANRGYPAQTYLASDPNSDGIYGVMDYRCHESSPSSIPAMLNAGYSNQGLEGDLDQTVNLNYWEPDDHDSDIVKESKLLWYPLKENNAHVDFNTGILKYL